jgi:hypothetical protein
MGVVTETRRKKAFQISSKSICRDVEAKQMWYIQKTVGVEGNFGR